MTSQKKYNEIIDRLLKPVKLGEQWKINLSEELCRYQQCILNCNFGGTVSNKERALLDVRPKATFIEAGLVIENASHIYALRVDDAYESMLNCNESLRKTLLKVSSKNTTKMCNTEKEYNEKSQKDESNKQRRKSISKQKKLKNSSNNYFSEAIQEINQELKVKQDKSRRNMLDRGSFIYPSSPPIFLQRKKTIDQRDVVNEPIISSQTNEIANYKFDYMINSNLVNRFTRAICCLEREAISNNLSQSRDESCTDIFQDTFEDSGIGNSSVSYVNSTLDNLSCFSPSDLLSLSDLANTNMEDITSIASSTYLLQKVQRMEDDFIRLRNSLSRCNILHSTPLESSIQSRNCKVLISRISQEKVDSLTNKKSSNAKADKEILKKEFQYVHYTALKSMKINPGFLSFPLKYLRKISIFNICKILRNSRIRSDRISKTARNKTNASKISKKPQLIKGKTNSNKNSNIVSSKTYMDSNKEIGDDNIMNSGHANTKTSQLQMLQNENIYSTVSQYLSCPTPVSLVSNNRDGFNVVAGLPDVHGLRLTSQTPRCRTVERLLTDDSGIDVNSSNSGDVSIDALFEPPFSQKDPDQSILDWLRPNVYTHAVVKPSPPIPIIAKRNQIQQPRVLSNLPRQVNLMEKYKLEDAQMDTEIHQWQHLVKHKLESSANSNKFCLSDYKRKILDKLKTINKRQSSFKDISDERNYNSTGRYLLAALQLTNEGKVHISQDRSENLLDHSSVCIKRKPSNKSH